MTLPVHLPPALVLAILAMATPATARAQEARAVLDVAFDALGVDATRTLQVSGRGSDFLFGQMYDGHSAWPRFNVPQYRLLVDYTTSSVREERTRTQAQNPPLGGGNQPIPEQRQVWSSTPATAWNGDGTTAAAAGRERDQRSAVEARQLWIQLTPQGFLRAARDAGAASRQVTVAGQRRTIVSFRNAHGRTLHGTLTDEGLVERIETWLSSPVLGDTLLEASFRDYRRFAGLTFPGRIIHREGGYPILDIVVTHVAVNVDARIDAPPSAVAGTRRSAVSAGASPAPVEVADGVWSVPLGPRDRSVAIEFKDHVIVVEAPSDEPTSLEAIAAIRTVIPGKPIRYIVNSHIHFDHSGGLRTYAAEGATVVTHASNVEYFRQVWANPWTIAPDRLARSARAPVFEGIVGSRSFTDGERTLVVYHYAGNFHHPGMLMVHLPHERILIEADSFNPPNTRGAQPNALPNLVQFYGAVERLRLDVETILPLHGRITTWREGREAIEAFGESVLWPQ
jgi:glyoxylase-like metal-dependent hydrolase (beta-lactamase superfamily II)